MFRTSALALSEVCVRLFPVVPVITYSGIIIIIILLLLLLLLLLLSPHPMNFP
jgi:hypothetical protein